jgi:hypothetical protein
MASVEKVTFCRICEPCCGLVATVRDGRLEALRPDRDNPLPASVLGDGARPRRSRAGQHRVVQEYSLGVGVGLAQHIDDP